MIKTFLCFYNESWGPTIIFRREVVKERYPLLPIGEDTYFTVKTSLRYRVANIPEILYRYRVHARSATRSINNYAHRKQVFKELLVLRIGFLPTDEQIDAHLTWRYGLKGNTDGSRIANQLKWIIYALVHGKYTRNERIILAVGCILGSVKPILRSIAIIDSAGKKYKSIRGWM